jgi:hypothetical protein
VPDRFSLHLYALLSLDSGMPQATMSYQEKTILQHLEVLPGHLKLSSKLLG